MGWIDSHFLFANTGHWGDSKSTFLKLGILLKAHYKDQDCGHKKPQEGKRPFERGRIETGLSRSKYRSGLWLQDTIWPPHYINLYTQYIRYTSVTVAYATPNYIYVYIFCIHLLSPAFLCMSFHEIRLQNADIDFINSSILVDMRFAKRTSMDYGSDFFFLFCCVIYDICFSLLKIFLVPSR